MFIIQILFKTGIKVNPTIKIFAYLWLQLKESLSVLIALNACLGTYYVLLVCLHGVYNKGLLKSLNIQLYTSYNV